MGKIACIIVIAFFMVVVGIGKGDITKDRQECGQTLVTLSVCLPYVGGDSKAPTMDCCSNLKTLLANSRKCLCVLIRDHDDPDLGLKVNATLALGLPDICKATANITECIDLLHLEPNSKSAKMFLDYANTTKMAATASPVASGSPNGNATSTVAAVKNEGGSMKRLGLDNMLVGVVIVSITFHLFYNIALL